MIRRLIVLMLALAVFAPARPAVAACADQKDHHCACTAQMTSATCCCTGKEIPIDAQGEAPQPHQADPGLLPVLVEAPLACSIAVFECSSPAGRPLAASPTPLFLLNGTFLN